VLLGTVAVGERRSRELLSLGARAASIAAWPAAQGWRSPLAAPLRTRTGALTDGLAREGEELAAGVRSRVEALMRELADQIANSGAADELVERVLSSGAFDNVVTVVIDHPATEAAIASALDAPGMERLIARVMDSRMVDDVVERLLESDEMRLILDYVTRSPELRAALAHQTAGLAGDVAVGVRSRTVAADDATERVARSLFRRRQRTPS
jgi:hypothetical protein